MSKNKSMSRASIGKAEGRKKKGKGQKSSVTLFALLAVAMMLLVSLNTSQPISGSVIVDNETGIEYHDITYHYGTDDANDPFKPVTVRYYGIASTEYNPEVWKNSLKALGGDVISINDIKNGDHVIYGFSLDQCSVQSSFTDIFTEKRSFKKKTIG